VIHKDSVPDKKQVSSEIT